MRLTLAALLTGGAATGYMAWRYYDQTGRLLGADWRRTRRFLKREEKRLRKETDRLLASGTQTAADMWEATASGAGQLEEWFRAQDLDVPTIDDLEELADRYDRMLAVRRDRDDRPPQVLDDGPPPDTSSTLPHDGNNEQLEHDHTFAETRSQEAGGLREDPAEAETQVGQSPAHMQDKPEAPPHGASDAPAASPDALTSGTEAFREGIREYQAAGEPGSREEQLHLRNARAHFVRAQELLTAAKHARQDDAKIDTMLLDTNRFLYGCMKRIVVDVHR